MKSRLSGNQANDQQWETVVLKKSTKPNVGAKPARVLSEEEKIERQKKITPVLRKNIQTARLAKKMTQQQLASAASLDINIIKQFETGSRIFNEGEVKKLERALGCKLQRS